MDPAPRQKPCILVVDDEEQHRHIASYVLRRQYQVLTASHAEEAMAVARAHAIDLALVDYRMPGETGVAFLCQLRTVHPDCIRFLVTAYADEALLKEAINEAGVYRFVTKPVNFGNLEMDIRRALEHRAAQVQARRGEQLAQAGSLAEAAAFELRACVRDLAAAAAAPAPVGAALSWIGATMAACLDEIDQAARGEVPQAVAAVGPLDELVARVVAAQAPRLGGRRVEVDLPAALPAVRRSPPHAERVIAALLRRAADATTAAGQLVVRARTDEGGGVTIEVADDGAPPGAAELDALRVPPAVDAPAAARAVALSQAAMRAQGGELRCHPATAPAVGTTYAAHFAPAPAS